MYEGFFFDEGPLQCGGLYEYTTLFENRRTIYTVT